jgi:mannan polymerase II complex MNN10 subunit
VLRCGSLSVSARSFLPPRLATIILPSVSQFYSNSFNLPFSSDVSYHVDPVHLPTVASSNSPSPFQSKRRRRSSAATKAPPPAALNLAVPTRDDQDARTSGLSPGSFGNSRSGQHLPTIPGTPVPDEDRRMSLSRTPSPVPGGGWRSEGLTDAADSVNGGGGSPLYPTNPNTPWASSQARSSRVNGYQSYSSKNQGFFRRHLRKLSSSLPMFVHDGPSGITEAEREKIERGDLVSGGGYWPMNSNGKYAQMARRTMRSAWRMRLRLGIVLGLLFCIIIFYVTRKSPSTPLDPPPLTGQALHRLYRRYIGGGSKFVIVLGANEGGGVMEWKGPREWAIERDSVRNKRRYAQKWGYSLEIVDMTTKKRYAHEWRESWEKVDTMRNAMRKYPNAEW